MKFTRMLLAVSLIVLSACSSVKTRKEAAEDAKLKAAAAENAPPPMGPIEEDIDDASVTGTSSKPVEDQILNDELAAMGIDPSNPEPEVQKSNPAISPHGNPVPMPENYIPPPPVKKAAVKNTLAKKPVKKKKPKKPVKKK